MSSRLIDEFGKDRGEILECAWQDTALDGVRAYQVYVKYPSPPAEPPQSQVEAVMNVLAPLIDVPTGGQVRWPVYRLTDSEGRQLVPNDDQVRAMAEQIVTAVRTSSGEV